MKLIPVGITSQKFQVTLIKSSNGTGFWLYSPHEILFGESKILEVNKKNVRLFELNNAWLVVEIAENNKVELTDYIKNNNPRELSEEELNKILNDEEELQQEIEIYIRYLIRTNVTHPVLREYKEKINQVLLENNVTDYQRTLVFACLKHRHVEERFVEVDTADPQIGYIDAQKVQRGELTIGMPNLELKDLDNPLITEDLIQQLYLFASFEHNQEVYATEKMQRDSQETDISEGEKKMEQKTKTEGELKQKN